MEMQGHPKLDFYKEASSGITMRNPIAIFTLIFLIGLYPCTAKGQFSGPALGAVAPVNLPVTPTTDPAILYPANRDIVLEHGDLLSIHLYGSADYQPEVRVSLDGTIQLPLVGSLHVDGLTLPAAERLIADRLAAAGMYRNPQVSIQLTEAPSQAVTISGDMHGVIPVTGQKRLFDVLSAAGGLPATASHLITINRPGVSQPIIVDLGTDPAKSERADVPVFPRDTIVVSRVGVIYLLGAFKNQGAIPLQQNSPLTLMQAASLGGGVGFEGKLDEMRVVRTVGYDRKVLDINVKKVMQGKAPDPVLQADDIVLLPTSAMKAAIKSGGLATLTSIGSVLILAFR